MQRDPRAYLNDILEAAAAIQAATVDVTAETYGSNRIPEARQIIDFRNLLTHEYSSVSDRIVWGCIQTDLPLLAEHCLQELQDLNQESR